MGSGDWPPAAGDCTQESGGDKGNSGKSSRNRETVRFGVVDRFVAILVNDAGSIWRLKDSREVLENSDGVVTRPRSVESRFILVSLLLKSDRQWAENLLLVSESLRLSRSTFGGGSGVTGWASSEKFEMAEGSWA